MELRKDYAGIVDANVGGLSDIACERIELVALACQELADRPPRELTDAEIHKVVALHGYVAADGSMLHKMLKAIEAAAHAKQREPQVVKFRAARNGHSNAIELFRLADDGAPLNEYFKPAGWEWLEPAQEFEVRT